MNIQDAIRSGKPFKRRAWGGYYKVDNDVFSEVTKFYTIGIGPGDILADDWEIKEEFEDAHISIKPHRWWLDFNKDEFTIPLQRHNLEEIRDLKDVKIQIEIVGKRVKS